MKRKNKIIIFSSVVFVVILVVLSALFLTHKTKEIRFINALNCFHVDENDNTIQFAFITDRNPDIDFLDPENILSIQPVDAPNLQVTKYEILPDTSTDLLGARRHRLSLYYSVKGEEPIVFEKINIKTKNEEHTYDIGHTILNRKDESKEPESMGILGNIAMTARYPLHIYYVMYKNEGNTNEIVEKIDIDPNFLVFNPRVYLSNTDYNSTWEKTKAGSPFLDDELAIPPVKDISHINFVIPPEKMLTMIITFEEQDVPYDLFGFSTTIHFQNSKILYTPELKTGLGFRNQKDVDKLFHKYFG